MTACYNEEENIRSIYSEVKNVFDGLEGYDYEHIFIDNASKDGTVSILKEMPEKTRL